VAEHTPPPSPSEAGNFKIDTQGIDDDIVVGVIEQLEKTGNRPHLLKELAAVLSNTLPIVERSVDIAITTKPLTAHANTMRSSANPSAIISSRLATYLRRTWSALSPCPLAKELVGTHPRRIYFFLTTSPRQAFPETVDLPNTANRIISPSLSSAADEEEEENDARARSQLSPSPEIDLSSPDLEDDSTSVGPGASFSGREPLIRDGTHPPTTTNMAHNRRAVSPPLERDEREFTQTASSLQQRRRSQTVDTPPAPLAAPSVSAEDAMSISVSIEDDESEESAALRNSEAAAALFGQADGLLSLMPPQAGAPFASSPVLRPQLGLDMSHVKGFALDAVRVEEDVKMEEKWSWTELKSPENVELDELDDLFESY